MLSSAIRYVLSGLLWIVVIAALAVVIVPRFLDRIYYEGAASDHFDGARFFNPDGEDTARVPGRGGRAGFFWNQATGRDARPPWPASVPVTPSKPAARVAGDAMVATWIGHASVLVQTQGLNILTDPVWSERAGPFGFGPQRVAAPGVRFFGPQRVAAPGVRFDDLPKIDLIVVSHNHYDHMDLATLKRLWDRDRPLIVTSLGNDAILRDAGITAVAADWGQRIPITPPCDDGAACIAKPGSVQPAVHVTRNHHWGSRWFTDRNRALWSSFVVQLPGGNVFFAGDTGMGDGRWPAEAAALGPIRLALIPIGAFRFEPGQMGTGSHIGPVDAVEVFRRLGAATALPIHWGTFRLSYEGWDEPPKLLRQARVCAGLGTEMIGARFDSVPPGGRIVVAPLDPAAPVRPRAARPAQQIDRLNRCVLSAPEPKPREVPGY